MAGSFIKNIAIFSVIFIVSCVNNVKEHGIIVKDADLDKLRLGGSKQFIVKKLLGPPSIEEKRDGNVIWFYINYKKNKKPLRKPELTHYMIVELIFDNSTLSEIQKYDLEDINKVAFNSHVTFSKKQKHNIFKELLRNIGRFDGASDI